MFLNVFYKNIEKKLNVFRLFVFVLNLGWGVDGPGFEIIKKDKHEISMEAAKIKKHISRLSRS